MRVLANVLGFTPGLSQLARTDELRHSEHPIARRSLSLANLWVRRRSVSPSTFRQLALSLQLTLSSLRAFFARRDLLSVRPNQQQIPKPLQRFRLSPQPSGGLGMTVSRSSASNECPRFLPIEHQLQKLPWTFLQLALSSLRAFFARRDLLSVCPHQQQIPKPLQRFRLSQQPCGGLGMTVSRSSGGNECPRFPPIEHRLQKLIWTSLGFALLLPGALAQEQSAPTPLDRDAFTFLNWNLDARIETKAESLSVRGKILLRNDSARPQTQITLQLSSSLRWASIKMNGNPVPFTTARVRSDVDHSGSVEEAVITPEVPVKPGASIEIEVGYSGTVSLDTTRLANFGVPLEVRVATDYDRITPTFTCLRGVGHVLWFPVSLEPALMSDGNRVFEEVSAWAVRHSASRMTVAIDNSLRGDSTWKPRLVFSNSGSVSYTDFSRMEWINFDWVHLGLAGPVILGGNYRSEVARQGPDPPPLTVLHFPEHDTEAQDYARVIRETTPTLVGRSTFRASVIELPEAQDTTFDGDEVFLTPFKPIDRKSLEVTVAYLLAHQTLWSPRAWIYEGAAHLAQALMRERQDGRASAIAFMAQRLPPFLMVESGSPDTAKSNSLINTTSEVFYRTKAMYVWWMLRDIVSQRALFDSLQQYDPAADTEPSYIQKLLEKNSKKDLEWFFDDWVYQDHGLPEFKVSNGYARPSLQGIYLVSATIENTGGAGAEVPVILHTENGDVVSRLRVPAHGKTAARIEVGSRPIELTVNDGSVPETDRSDHTTPIRIGTQ